MISLDTGILVLLCSRIARDAGPLVYIINLEKSAAPAAAVGVTPKNAYCGAVDWRTGVKFSGHVGHVIQQVVSSFEPGAVDGVAAARAHVRHRVNMGNGKLGDCVKIDRQRSDPGLIARQPGDIATCSQHWWIEDRMA